MTELPLGAHVTSPRFGFVHHGIYAGDKQVIHYGGFERALLRRPVEIVPLAQFTRGRGLAVPTAPCPRLSGIACIERARSRLGEDRYRLWSNNYEHFAEWCVSGSSRSMQVDAFRERPHRRLAAVTRVFRLPTAMRLVEGGYWRFHHAAQGVSAAQDFWRESK